MAETLLEGLGPDPMAGKHWDQLSQEHQEAAIQRLENLQDPTIHRARLQQAEAETKREVAAKKAPKSALQRAHQRVVELPKHEEAIREGFTFDAGASRFADDISRSMGAARAHAEATGELLLPQGQDFYDTSLGVSRNIAGHTLGSDPLSVRRVLKGGSIFSEQTAPVMEYRATRGAAEIVSGGDDLAVRVTPEFVESLNDRLRRANMSEQDRTSGMRYVESIVSPMLTSSGSRFLSVEQMHPAVLAHALTQFKGVKAFEDVKSFAGDPLLLSSAIDVQRGLGTGGFNKALRAFSGMTGPGVLGDVSQFKVPSYTRDKARRENPRFSAAVRHHTGIATHGDAWLRQNPDAFNIIAESYDKDRHLWDENAGTADVWAARAATGLPPESAAALGDTIRPENLFKVPDVVRASWSRRTKPLPGARAKMPPGLTSDEASYSLLEGMMTEAGRRHSVHVPGVGRIPMITSEAQQLAWPVIQEINPMATGYGQPDVVRLNPGLARSEQVNPAPDPYVDRPAGTPMSIPATRKRKVDDEG